MWLAAGIATFIVQAIADEPERFIVAAGDRLSRIRGTVATPTAALVDAAGALSDPAGSVVTVSGSTTFGGGADAALVRLAP